MCSGHNSQSVPQSYQKELTIEAGKWLFLSLKPKWYLNIKLETFSSFLVMVIVNNGCFFIQKAYYWFQAFPGFSFLLLSIFKKLEITENFQKLICRGINSIYLISSTFLSILSVGDKTLIVLLKVIKEHLLWKLEIDFSCY